MGGACSIYGRQENVHDVSSGGRVEKTLKAGYHLKDLDLSLG